MTYNELALLSKINFQFSSIVVPIEHHLLAKIVQGPWHDMTHIEKPNKTLVIIVIMVMLFPHELNKGCVFSWKHLKGCCNQSLCHRHAVSVHIFLVKQHSGLAGGFPWNDGGCGQLHFHQMKTVESPWFSWTQGKSASPPCWNNVLVCVRNCYKLTS